MPATTKAGTFQQVSSPKKTSQSRRRRQALLNLGRVTHTTHLQGSRESFCVFGEFLSGPAGRKNVLEPYIYERSVSLMSLLIQWYN
ncbi:hypothetical protein NPIL_414551 [Nephila pilipes]|uniref:Uncharacterized protein n=1 Tax=Nephila pilipes TaxID=299642 RepID=A0A8X6NNQ2_NEPPI|nr:hypothetical protein NPIL_414551 [Nephila pilipes]